MKEILGAYQEVEYNSKLVNLPLKIPLWTLMFFTFGFFYFCCFFVGFIRNLGVPKN